MSLRWRIDGRLLCGAKTEPQAHDTYIDDSLHYHLSLTGVIEPDLNEAKNGLWHWREARPPYWDDSKNPDQRPALPANTGMASGMLTAFERALAKIARGRTDNGRPLAGEAARQIAREALTQHDREW